MIISIDAGICGGKPCIAGTRIRVWEVHVWHDLRGQSPEEIVASFPQFSLADVHAALAYYLDHREELEQHPGIAYCHCGRRKGRGSFPNQAA